MGNEELKAKYDEMHSQGPSAWFNDGKEERELILKMGEPWVDLAVLEIGCGEGDLAYRIFDRDAKVLAIDYSSEAIAKAKKKWAPNSKFRIYNWDYKDKRIGKHNRLVMQGVLEHLDDPFTELKWMIDNFKPKSIITSSPCFLNPRGIVWMTLHMLGAVMSKTDLHFLNPWEFGDFCSRHGYKLSRKDCDWDWGHGTGMIADLRKRIPLALKDGNLVFYQDRLESLMEWLSRFELGSIGATMVYRIDL